MMQSLQRWGIIALTLLALLGGITLGLQTASAQVVADGDYTSSPLPPGPLNFGSVDVNGGTSTQSLTITNNHATENLVISEVSINGLDQDNYSIVTAIPDGGFILTPGASQAITVQCDPVKTGTLNNATLRIGHSDDEFGSPLNYNLTCTGQGPSYTSVPPSENEAGGASPTADFGNVPADTTSTPLVVTTISNSGAGSEALAMTIEFEAGLGINNTSFRIVHEGIQYSEGQQIVVNRTPGQTYDLTVVCKPGPILQTTEIFGKIRVTHNGLPPGYISPEYYTVRCNVTVPDIDATPNPLVFPGTAVGNTSTATLTISNVASPQAGQGPLRITGFTIIGTNASDFAVATPPTFPIIIGAAPASTTVDFTCTPSAIGPRTATLQITSNDPDEPVYEVTLECAAVSPEYDAQYRTMYAVPQALQPAPNGGTIDFGTRFMNTPGTIVTELQITNAELGGTGTILNLPTDMSQWVIGGANPSNFTIVSVPAAGIAEGATAIAEFRCLPGSTAGVKTATLTFPTNDLDDGEGIITYTLSCTVVEAMYASVPAPNSTIAFGDVTVGSISAPMTITITDPGSGILTINSITETDPDGVFTITVSDGNDSPTPPLPGPYTVRPQSGTGTTAQKQLVLSITCSPTALVPYTGEITVDHNGTNIPTPVVYPLTCNGVQGGYASTPPPGSTIIVGEVISGSGVNAQQTIAITNTGTGPYNITAFNLAPDSGPFQLSFPTALPETMSGGETRTLTITCLSTAANGAYTRTLTVANTSPNEPAATYTLTCNVHPPDPQYSSDPVPDLENPVNAGTIEIDFGLVVVGTTATRPITITNTGQEALTINYASIPAAPFGVNPSSLSTPTLNPGQSTTINVTCSPTATGAVPDDTLEIGHNDPNLPPTNPAVYHLRCQGSTSGPGYASAPAAVGQAITITAPVGGTGAYDLSISEIGNATLVIQTLQWLGPDAALFGPTSTFISIADGGAPQNLRITCSPTAPGSFTATLRVETNAINVTPDSDADGFNEAEYPVTCIAGTTTGQAYSGPANNTVFTITTPVNVQGMSPFSITNIGGSGSLLAGTLTRDTAVTQITVSPSTFAISGGSAQPFNFLCFSAVTGTFSTTFTVAHNGEAPPGLPSPLTYTVNCTVIAATATFTPTLTVTPGGPTLTPTITLTPSRTATGAPPNYTSNPLQGGSIVVDTSLNATSATGQLFIQNTGGGTLNVVAQLPSGLSSRVFLTQSSLSLGAGQSGTIDFQCVTSAAGTTSGTLQVTSNDPDMSTAVTYTVVCNVSSVTATPQTAQQTSTAAALGTTTPSNVQQCSEGQVLSLPLPSDASGEYLLVNCFLVTGPGAINITLTQVLTNPFSAVDATDITIINSNPGLMTIWRMGSWFLIPSTYNAATTTYQFEAVSGTQVYAFFYGAITVPVNSQTTVTTTIGPETATGNVEDEMVNIPVKEEEGIDPRAILISTVVTVLLAVGFFTVVDRRKKRHQV